MRKTAILSARSPEALGDKCAVVANLFRSKDGGAAFRGFQAWQPPASPSYHRAGFVWDSRQKAVDSLERIGDALERGIPDGWTDGAGSLYRTRGIDPERERLVGLFSGQGALFMDMGRQLMGAFPIFRQGFSHMDDIMSRSGLLPVSELVFPDNTLLKNAGDRCNRYLNRTEYTQPAIGIFAAGLYRLLGCLGFAPAMLGGLSFGEITALWAGGVFSDAAFFNVVHIRGMAMALEPEPVRGKGAMMAVSGEGVSRISRWVDPIPDIVVESWNSNRQVVLSGLRSSLETFQFYLQENGFEAYMLPVSGAFHSPFMEVARQAFAESMASLHVSPPEIPVFSNLTAAPYPPDPDAIRQMMADHILQPVLFRDMIERMYDHGGYAFVEFGPKRVLSDQVDDILGHRPHLSVPLNSGNRTRTRYQLRQPLRFTLSVQGRSPVSCSAKSVSRDGLRLEGLPRQVKLDKGTVTISFDETGLRRSIEARLVWRQGYWGGLAITDKLWTRDIFPELSRHLPKTSAVGPDKDCDRQFREAIMTLMVYGYPLQPLDRLFLPGALPSFDVSHGGETLPAMPEEWARAYWESTPAAYATH